MNIDAAILSEGEESFRLIPAGKQGDSHVFVRLEPAMAVLLDDRLEIIEHRSLEAEKVLAARRLEWIVATDGSGLVIYGPQRVELSGHHCISATFVGSLVIAIEPFENGHIILLIDPEDGQILDEVALDLDDAAAFITDHPHEDVVLIEFPMGQDGSVVQRVDIVGGKLKVQEVLAGQDPVLAGFNADGTRLLVAPYPDDPELVRILEWPTLTELARIEATSLQAEYGFGLAMCWVDQNRVAFYATEQALFVADAVLADATQVQLPIEFGDQGELENLQSLAPGRLVAGIWTPAGRKSMVFEL